MEHPDFFVSNLTKFSLVYTAKRGFLKMFFFFVHSTGNKIGGDEGKVVAQGAEILLKMGPREKWWLIFILSPHKHKLW